MRCLVCGEEMRLVRSIPDETMLVPGFEQQTLTCPSCHAHPVLSARVCNTLSEELFTTSVTVEEQLKGRLAYIHRYRNRPPQLVQGHAALVRTIYYFARWNILYISE